VVEEFFIILRKPEKHRQNTVPAGNPPVDTKQRRPVPTRDTGRRRETGTAT
jgi:hypothetical protein